MQTENQSRITASLFFLAGYVIAFISILENNYQLPYGLPLGLPLEIWLDTFSGEVIPSLLAQALGAALIPLGIAAICAHFSKKYAKQIPKLITFSIYFFLISLVPLFL